MLDSIPSILGLCTDPLGLGEELLRSGVTTITSPSPANLGEAMGEVRDDPLDRGRTGLGVPRAAATLVLPAPAEVHAPQDGAGDDEEGSDGTKSDMHGTDVPLNEVEATTDVLLDELPIRLFEGDFVDGGMVVSHGSRKRTR